MNRRAMFGRLLSIGAGTALAIKPAAAFSLTDPFTHGIYSCYWTGWKVVPDQAIEVGQWLATPTDAENRRPLENRPAYVRPNLHVNVPGMRGGSHMPGCVFDTSWSWSKRAFVDMTTSDAQRKVLIQEGRVAIIRLVDLFSEYPSPSYNIGGPLNVEAEWEKLRQDLEQANRPLEAPPTFGFTGFKS